MLTRDEARTVCDTVLSLTGQAEAIVSLRSSTESHARFADNNLTTSGRADDLDVRITVWVDGRRGSASTNDPSNAALTAAVGGARLIASVSPPDREHVPVLGATEYAPSRGYADSTANLSLPSRGRALAAVLDACRSADIIGAGFHDAQGETIATATSGGNFRYFQSTQAGLSVTARAKDGTGSGYFARDHFDVARLDHTRIVKEAIEKSQRSRGAKPIDAGTYRVILEPQAVADVLPFLTESFDARTADEGRSAFSKPEGRTKVGEPLFDAGINLFSDPAHDELPVPPATDEGVPATPMSIIRAGVLANLVYSRFWARTKEREPSPGPVNFILQGTGQADNVADMIKAADRALLITRFWYVRLVDPRSVMVTGLTRDGVWLIENGRVQRPVGNLRFNQSLLAMLAPGNVEMVGVPERRYPMMVPALKLKSFTFTSQSDAV